MTAAWMLPSPAPYEGPERCIVCAGARITGDRWQFGRTEPRRLVVDVFCPACDGCGRARHDDCPPSEHADADNVLHDDDEDTDDQACPSCRGRHYWVALGFADDGATFRLRVACGCTEQLLVPVEVDP